MASTLTTGTNQVDTRALIREINARHIEILYPLPLEREEKERIIDLMKVLPDIDIKLYRAASSTDKTAALHEFITCLEAFLKGDFSEFKNHLEQAKAWVEFIESEKKYRQNF